MGQAYKSQTFPLPAARAEALLTPDQMARQVMEFAPATDAEALKILRARYPDAPLSLRVAALGFLMRKRSLADLARITP